MPPTSPGAGILGLITAATITIGFALPHLLLLKNTAPIRVLRHDLPPPRLGSGVTYGVAIGMLLAMIWFIVRDLALVGLHRRRADRRGAVVGWRRLDIDPQPVGFPWRGRRRMALRVGEHLAARPREHRADRSRSR